MLCVCDFSLDGFSEGISANSRNCFFFHRKDVHLEKVLLFVWKNWPSLERMFKTS